MKWKHEEKRKKNAVQTDRRTHWGLTANLSIFFGNPVYVHSCHLPHSSHTHTHVQLYTHRAGNMSFVYPLRIVCFVSCINPFYAFYVPNSCLNILLTCLARLLSYSLPHSFSLPPSLSLCLPKINPHCVSPCLSTLAKRFHLAQADIRFV